MPSPFPGMDPWLENPAHWPGVHSRLINEMATAINRVVRPKYLAAIEERVFVSGGPEAPRRTSRVSDVQIVDDRPGGAVAATAVAVADSVWMRAVPRREYRQRRVEVRDAESQSVVTVIELLSPTNKSDIRGRASFLRKRREVLRSPAHWVEIDLLRGGEPTFDRPAHLRADFAIHSAPAERRPLGRVWAIPLAARLPVIDIPLRAPDPDVPLDLQAVLAEAYDRGSLDGLAGYGRDPVPPLPPEQAEWADGVLKTAGLR